MDQPIEARCDHCKQPRPLFLYEPDHNAHFNPNIMLVCRWCSRDKQPLLCARCWSAEALREENDPLLAEEAETMEQICAANRRAYEREQANRDACEGIARATTESEAAQ